MLIFKIKYMYGNLDSIWPFEEFFFGGGGDFYHILIKANFNGLWPSFYQNQNHIYCIWSSSDQVKFDDIF